MSPARRGWQLPVLTETCKSLRQGYQIHAQTILHGLHSHLYSLSKIFSFFALFGCPESLGHARLIFSETASPNAFMWNTLIRAHSRGGLHREALLLYPSMVAQAKDLPNNFTFTFLLNSCAKFPEPSPGFQIYGHVVKLGFESDAFIRNVMMFFLCNSGHAKTARKLFEENCVRDLVSYNTMISGMAQVGDSHAALSLFREMLGSGFWPDEFTFVALSSACSGLKNYWLGKQIHSLVYRYLKCVDYSSGAHLVVSVIDLYSKCGAMDMAERVFSAMRPVKNLAVLSSMISGYARVGNFERARKIFDEVIEKDAVLWTAMISGYSQSGQYDEALRLYKQMDSSGIKPDQVTICAVLTACAGFGALTVGERIYNQFLKGNIVGRDVILVTTVVDMYAKCGKIDSALEIFRDVPNIRRTTHLFNAMITGLAQHGLGEAAVSLFVEMESAGARPDGVTFLGLLCACSHTGLVKEGWSMFKSMSDTYGISPQLQHYCCMVDLLGRDGKIDEAHDFIRAMPFEANSVIWRSLLSSCKLHGNVEMGKIASAKILEMEPKHGARYVLLSNILATTKQWEEAGRMRKGMEADGILKPPGWSYIELSDGSVHQFTASNYKFHPHKEEIAAKLKDMSNRLRDAGYAPNTVDVVFDVDEEEKETVVSYHSEKLALAFGLLNSGPGEVLRIMKNLRICGDCHSAFNLLSKSYEHEFVVRDSSRFHHFRNGLCSCKDFW